MAMAGESGIRRAWVVDVEKTLDEADASVEVASACAPPVAVAVAAAGHRIVVSARQWRARQVHVVLPTVLRRP